MRQNLWVFAAVAACSCGLAAPDRGTVLSPGVGHAVFEARSNATDLVDVRVVYPANDDGTAQAGPFPAVIFVQGGLVETGRYLWQAEALARAGYGVALPEHPLDLAIMSAENGAAARRLLVDPPARSVLSGLVDSSRIGAAGHSLGGVVATKVALLGGFKALVLEASYPDEADRAAVAALTIPSLSLAGRADCSAKLADVTARWELLPSPTALVVLDGVTHYQFTDSDREDAKRSCTGGTLEDAHARIVGALTAFLETALVRPAVGEPALRGVEGAEVTAR